MFLWIRKKKAAKSKGHSRRFPSKERKLHEKKRCLEPRHNYLWDSRASHFQVLEETNSKPEKTTLPSIGAKNGVCPRLTLKVSQFLSYFLKPIIALHAKPFQSIIIKRRTLVHLRERPHSRYIPMKVSSLTSKVKLRPKLLRRWCDDANRIYA